MPYINPIKQKKSIIIDVMEIDMVNSNKIETNLMNKYQTRHLFGFVTGKNAQNYSLAFKTHNDEGNYLI